MTSPSRFFVRPYPPSSPPSSFVSRLRAITAAGQRASVSLEDLLSLSELEAELVIPSPAPKSLLRAPVVGVTVIDLADPRPHLSGQEVVLTTGLGFEDNDAWYEEYARVVREAGSVALGFGVEPVFSEVPAGLIRGCRKAGLPLIAFPPHIPFAHITTAFYALLEQDRLGRLERLNALALDMMHAALSRSPADGVVHALARYLGGIVILERGTDRRVAGSLTDATADEISAAVAARTRSVPSSERNPRRTDRFHLASGIDVLTGTARSSRARLPLNTQLTMAAARPLHGTDLTAFQLAVDTLRVAHAADRASSASADALTMSLILDSLSRPASPLFDRSVRLLRSTLNAARNGSLTVVVARKNDGNNASAADLAWWRTDLSTPFVDIDRGVLRAICRTAPDASMLRAIQDEGWNVQLVGPVDPVMIPAAMVDAEQLVLTASAGAGWSGLAAPSVRYAAARQLLKPLDDHPLEAATLRVWLDHHGKWDGAARELGVHRNVVRRRIAAAEERLDLPLDDARTRAELILAFDSLKFQQPDT